MPPISDMASDYVQAKAAREAHRHHSTVDASVKKIRDVVETTVKGMQAELQTLQDKLMIVERKAAPDYVINRNTGKWHRVLASYADAGTEAIAYCGFAFAKASCSTRFESSVPADIGWKFICSTCLPELRAARKGASGEP